MANNLSPFSLSHSRGAFQRRFPQSVAGKLLIRRQLHKLWTTPWVVPFIPKLGVYDAEESESAPNPEYSTDEGAEPGKARPTRGGSGGKGRCQGERNEFCTAPTQRGMSVSLRLVPVRQRAPEIRGSGRRHIQGKSRMR